MSDDNKQLTSEEVTAKVIEDYGFDPSTQSESIEKMTNERIENQKNLSKAIDQKVSYRTQGVNAGVLDPKTFEAVGKKPDGAPINNNQPNDEEFRDELRMIAGGTSPEDIANLKVISKGKGITMEEAKKDPMFTGIAEVKKQEEVKIQSQMGPSNQGVVAPPVQGGAVDQRAAERSTKHAEILQSFGNN